MLREAVEVAGFSMTRVQMCCGKSRYSVIGTLQPGDSVCLEDADGHVQACDQNVTATPRPTSLTRVLSTDHGLHLRLIRGA